MLLFCLVLFLFFFTKSLLTNVQFWIQKEKAVEEPEIDPDVAAMMGFGGFRSSKK